MLPTVTVFGRLTIPTYGPLILIGFILGTLVAVYLPVKKSLPRQDIFYCMLFALIGAAIGSKLLYIAISLPSLLEARAGAPLTINDITILLTYGFVFYGGLIGAVGGIIIYAKAFRLPLWPLTDSLLPSVPLMHAIGRIGCFCAGCCYGMPADPPLGVYFRPDSVAPAHVSLFPVQLLEAGLNFVLFTVLFVYSRKPRADRQITGLYIVCYGIIRFGLEFVRGDAGRGMFWGLSTSQWISIFVIPVGLYWLLRKCKKESIQLRPSSSRY